MSKKKVQITLENVYKCYQDAQNQKTKDFLTALFPDLDKKIKPHSKPNWVKGNKKRSDDYYEFLKVKGRNVVDSFTIDQEVVEYSCRIRIKYLPSSFLKDIEYFKEED